MQWAGRLAVEAGFPFSRSETQRSTGSTSGLGRLCLSHFAVDFFVAKFFAAGDLFSFCSLKISFCNSGDGRKSRENSEIPELGL